MKSGLVFIVLFCINGAISDVNKFGKINVKFFSGTSSRIYSQYYLSNITQLMTHNSFDNSRPTTLYIFGWLQNTKSDAESKLIDAYVRRGGYNFVVLDWSDYNVGWYSVVKARVPRVGRVAGRTFLKLFNKGLNDRTFHCVGHSFGAHICGFMGREIQESSRGRIKIGRITGLDPANWETQPLIHEHPLMSSDATFVDTIHTDGFFIGTRKPFGHVTFLPNNADVQPGCPPYRNNNLYNYISSYCSHINANRYWTESINPKRPQFFPAYKCSNWKDYKNGYCTKNPINYMGLDAKADIPGIFYIELKTKIIFNHDEQFLNTISAIGRLLIGRLSQHQ